jgi:hypothetical protein
MVKAGGHAYDLIKKAGKPSPTPALPPVGEEAGQETSNSGGSAPFHNGPSVAEHAATLAPPGMQYTEVKGSKRERAITASTRATNSVEDPADPERDV